MPNRNRSQLLVFGLITFVLTLALVVLFSKLGVGQTDGQPICDGTEIPCNEEKPWHRGSIHKGCSLDGNQIEVPENRRGPNWRASPEVWLSCECKHKCEPDNKETGGRGWDSICAARCSPFHCKCPSPCT